MAIDRSILPPPSIAGFDAREEGEDLVVSVAKQFDYSLHSTMWAVWVVRACRGPYARVVVDCRHQVSLTSTVIAGLVRLADEYAVPHGRRLILVGANERIRRLVARIQLDQLIDCVADEPAS